MMMAKRAYKETRRALRAYKQMVKYHATHRIGRPTVRAINGHVVGLAGRW
jgi:hypothetical protein